MDNKNLANTNLINSFLLNNRSVLNLSNYTTDELKIIIGYCKENIILNDQLKQVSVTIDNFENKNKNELEIILTDLWNGFPLVDNQSNPIECSICFSYLTISDNLLMQCNHQTHSSCFFNYLYSNFTSINKNKTNILDSENKINNLFRCPKCRTYLTPYIKNNVESSDMNQIPINTNYEYVSIQADNLNQTNRLNQTNVLNYSQITNSILTNGNYNIRNNTNNLNIDLISGLWTLPNQLDTNNIIIDYSNNDISTDDSDTDTDTNTNIDTNLSSDNSDLLLDD